MFGGPDCLARNPGKHTVSLSGSLQALRQRQQIVGLYAVWLSLDVFMPIVSGDNHIHRSTSSVNEKLLASLDFRDGLGLGDFEGGAGRSHATYIPYPLMRVLPVSFVNASNLMSRHDMAFPP